MCDASVGGEERRAEASREFDVCRVVSGESELSSAIERSAERAHRCRIDSTASCVVTERCLDGDAVDPAAAFGDQENILDLEREDRGDDAPS